MYFILKHLSTGNEIFLTERDYVVGRKNCDIALDDQSLSKKHALIRVTKDGVTLEDTGSKYHTLHNSSHLEPNKAVSLTHMDQIHFGIRDSKYQFEVYNFITTTTGISSSQRDSLRKSLETCRTKLVDKWSENCTHLTTENIVLTIKFLEALIDEKLIVVPEYWKQYAKNIQENLEPPDISKYSKPHLAEDLLNEDYNFNPDSTRKTLFKNKVFVFPSEKVKIQMESVIKRCGGETLSWEKSPLTSYEINTSAKEYLIMKLEKDENITPLHNVIKELQKSNKRAIPISEIALAIISSSCEKFCNPVFDRVNRVFGSRSPKTENPGTLWAFETQTEHSNQTCDEKKDIMNIIIPPTLEPNSILDNTAWKTSSSKKRLNDDGGDSAAKKVKVGDKGSEENISNTGIASSSNANDINKDVVKKENITLNKPETSKKRKAEEPLENPSKVINPFTLIKTCSKSTSQDANNPFAALKLNKKAPTKTQNISKDNPFLNQPKLSSSLSQNKINEAHKASTSTANKGQVDMRTISKPTILLRNKADMICTNTSKKSSLNLTWTSKGSPSKVETTAVNDAEATVNSETSRDLSMIVSVLESLLVKRREPLSQITNLDTGSSGKDFKKFKKVNPIHPQIDIIGRNQLTRTYSGANGSIPVEEEDSIRSDARPKAKKIIL